MVITSAGSNSDAAEPHTSFMDARDMLLTLTHNSLFGVVSLNPSSSQQLKSDVPQCERERAMYLHLATKMRDGRCREGGSGACAGARERAMHL